MDSPAFRIGKHISEEMFARFDEGAPFVLITLEQVHHHVFDQCGQYGTGRVAALAIMQKYLPAQEAERLWDEHTRDALVAKNAKAVIRGYFPEHRPPLES